MLPKPADKPRDSSPGNRHLPQPLTAEDVRSQLARILGNQGFVSSPRLCRFLRFLVERALEDDLDRLKEFVVALEVFDRDENYDPNIDSIVRVEARRLRSKLKTYYEGEGGHDPVFIGLRPGSYVPVFRPVTSQPPAAARTELSMPPGQLPLGLTVAVLPFVNMSPEPAQDYFCDGITEELINALTTVEGINVVARTSAFQFKGKAVDIREVGERLGAQVVIEGSVRKAGDQLRITAQAIHASNGLHVWSETYRREMRDVFEIQEEISRAIAGVLRVKLGERPLPPAVKSPPSLEAYTGYLNGRFLVHQQTVESLHAALDQYRRLTSLYPDYAPPYTGIAAAYGYLSLCGQLSGTEALSEMRRNVEIALRLDPGSPDACAAMAGLSAHMDYDWQKAEEYFKRVFAMQPGHADAHCWYGMALAAQGRFAQAESELRKSTQMDPLSAADCTRMGLLYYFRGDDSAAIDQFEKSFWLQADFPDAQWMLSLLLIRKGDYQAAGEVLSRNLERRPLPIHMGLLAGVLFRLGKAEQSRGMLRKLSALSEKGCVPPVANAFAFIGMGEADSAFEFLGRAITDRNPQVIFLNVDPYYDGLKSDARFAQLLRRLHLTS